MKTLRYLLSVIAIMGVLGVSAQTPKYGKPYKPVYKQARYSVASVEAQAPTATIGSVNSGYVQSGSTLPQAAVEGVTTTYTSTGSNGPRRAKMGDDDWEDDDPHDDEEPWTTPLGDAMWLMMMLALAYAIYKVSRMRRREEGC